MIENALLRKTREEYVTGKRWKEFRRVGKPNNNILFEDINRFLKEGEGYVDPEPEGFVPNPNLLSMVDSLNRRIRNDPRREAIQTELGLSYIIVRPIADNLRMHYITTILPTLRAIYVARIATVGIGQNSTAHELVEDFFLNNYGNFLWQTKTRAVSSSEYLLRGSVEYNREHPNFQGEPETAFKRLRALTGPYINSGIG